MSNFWGAFNQRKKVEDAAETWRSHAQRLANDNLQQIERIAELRLENERLKKENEDLRLKTQHMISPCEEEKKELLRKIEAWERLDHSIKKKY